MFVYLEELGRLQSWITRTIGLVLVVWSLKKEPTREQHFPTSLLYPIWKIHTSYAFKTLWTSSLWCFHTNVPYYYLSGLTLRTYLLLGQIRGIYVFGTYMESLKSSWTKLCRLQLKMVYICWHISIYRAKYI